MKFAGVTTTASKPASPKDPCVGPHTPCTPSKDQLAVGGSPSEKFRRNPHWPSTPNDRPSAFASSFIQCGTLVSFDCSLR